MKHLILSSLSILFVSGSGAIAQEASFLPATVSQMTAQTSNSQLIASGSFITTEQDHPTSGMATIVEENGQRYLVFDNNFTESAGGYDRARSGS